MPGLRNSEDGVYISMNTFNSDGRWVQCAHPECFHWIDTSNEKPVKSLLMSVPHIPVPAEKVWYACEQHVEQVRNAQFDVQLAFQKPAQANIRYLADELKTLIGYIYRKP